MKLKYLFMLTSVTMMLGNTWATEFYDTNFNKLNFYGKFNRVCNMSTNKNYSFICYGVLAEAKLSEKLIGFGILENKIKFQYTETEKINSPLVLLSLAGIKFADASSSIDYGRNYSIMYDISTWTDTMTIFDNGTDTSDDFLKGYANRMLTYRNVNFFGILDGLNFSIQHQIKNQTKKTSYEKNHKNQGENNNNYSLSVIFNLSQDISIGAAIGNSYYNSLHSVISGTKNQNKKSRASYLSLRYDDHHLYLAALYSEIRNIKSYIRLLSKNYTSFEEVRNFKFVTKYQLNCGINPFLSYQKSYTDRNYGKHHDVKKYVEIGVNYNLKENMLAFIDYRIKLPFFSRQKFTDAMQNSTNNTIGLGISYLF